MEAGKKALAIACPNPKILACRKNIFWKNFRQKFLKILELEIRHFGGNLPAKFKF